MIRTHTATALAVLLAASLAGPAAAKDKVKVAFIGPLTSGVAANGIGGGGREPCGGEDNDGRSHHLFPSWH